MGINIEEYRKWIERTIIENINSKVERGRTITNGDLEQIIGVISDCEFSEEAAHYLINKVLGNIGLLELSIEAYKKLVRIQEVSDTLKIAKTSRARESILIDWGE